MYVLTHNDQVLLGPIQWNAMMFNSTIEDDTEILTNIKPSDVNNVPLDLGNGLKIRACRDQKPPINPKTQILSGPIWTFTDTEGIALYTPENKNIELLKKEMLSDLSNERWKKECSGSTATIQGQTVTVDTSRGSRDVFAQQFLLLPDGQTIAWKFPEGWITLTKADLEICMNASSNHVQNAFQWEATLHAKIDNATFEELSALEIVPVVENRRNRPNRGM